MTGFAKVSLLKFEYGILGVRREDGERRFASGLLKAIRATHNAELRYESNHG